MKILNIIILIFALQVAYSQDITSVFVDTENKSNNFFDNSELHKLEIKDLTVDGEVKNPGLIDLSKLPLREIIVKETLLKDNEAFFIGAYRYIGYSLVDILNFYKIEKINADVFPPYTDLYVEIENEKGEKVVVSWGELYYTNQMHNILIAVAVARIVPEKSKDMWVLPTEAKLIVGSDLITERNISNPVKITVKTFVNDQIEIVKGKSPLFSPEAEIIVNGKLEIKYYKNSDFSKSKTLHTIFYGKGRGLHSTEPFTGLSLKDILKDASKFDKKNIQQSIVAVIADDGYCTVYSYSELCNRNDQQEVLLVCYPEATDNGIFRLYPSCDFFSDRAIKGIRKIILKNE